VEVFTTPNIIVAATLAQIANRNNRGSLRGLICYRGLYLRGDLRAAQGTIASNICNVARSLWLLFCGCSGNVRLAFRVPTVGKRGLRRCRNDLHTRPRQR
jgi:hypothetical protein